MNSSQERQERRILTKVRYLKQEIFREKNTCYPTALINAALAIDAITFYKAQLAYHAIVEELMKNPLLWDGPILVLGQTDHHVAEVIERNLPVKLGRSSSAKRGERTFISEWSFSSVLQGLGNRKSFVAIGEEEHALTITSAYGKALQFVDPQYPENLVISPSGLFHPKLDPNGDGKIDATLVSRANGK